MPSIEFASDSRLFARQIVQAWIFVALNQARLLWVFQFWNEVAAETLHRA